MEKEGRVSSQLHYGNYYKGDETKPLYPWLECSPNVDETEFTLPTTGRGASPYTHFCADYIQALKPFF